MNNTIGSYWETSINFFLAAYSFIVIVLLTFTLFLKGKYKGESYNFLYVLNTVAAWGSLINLIYYLAELFISTHDQNSYEWFATDRTYRYLFWAFVLQSIVPLIFLFRKLRTNRFVTLILLLVLHAGLIEDLLYKAFRNYLPSSWSVYLSEPHWQTISKWVFLIVALPFTYWLANKRKKLPFQSAILSYSLFFISYFSFPCIQHFN